MAKPKPVHLSKRDQRITKTPSETRLSRLKVEDLVEQEGETLSALARDPIDFDEIEFALSLLQGLDTPVALGVYLRLVHKEFSQVSELKISALDYLDADGFAVDYQAISILRKFEDLPINTDKSVPAVALFFTGEEQCRESNRKFSSLMYRDVPGELGDLLYSIKWNIQRILGKFRPCESLLRSRFGPGSSYGVHGTSDFSKLRERPTVTASLVPFIPGLVNDFPHWDSLNRPVVKNGGKYSQVPKDSRTNRNIEIQPLINGFLQLGVGGCIRERLEREGVDLRGCFLNGRWVSGGQQANKFAARQGSLNGQSATIDLSNASDTICYQLVKYLLPDDWFHVMDLLRTQEIYGVPGSKGPIPLERFSSMGNGFTFELESLIFYSLILSCRNIYGGGKGEVYTYGDDLVVPIGIFEKVCWCLKELGFTPNPKKSFSEGPFRESCGGDYFNGTEVRPHFLKEGVKDVASLISLANGILRAAGRRNCNFGYDRRFARGWSHCIQRLPVLLRRNIALGQTDTDDFLLSPKARRNGVSLIFLPKTYPIELYSVGKATALFRLWRKAPSGSSQIAGIMNAPRQVQAVILKARLSQKVTIKDYDRDDGSWGLRKAVVPPCRDLGFL